MSRPKLEILATSGGMDFERDLARIALQEELLQFDKFDAGVAWEIGSRLRNSAVAQGRGIAIDIRCVQRRYTRQQRGAEQEVMAAHERPGCREGQ